jgi:hypothetical protein
MFTKISQGLKNVVLLIIREFQENKNSKMLIKNKQKN